MPVRLTLEEFINRCILKNIDLPLNNQSYININTKMIFRCNSGHIYSRVPSNHLKGIGCPVCSQEIKQKNVKKTIEEYYKECSGKNIDMPIENIYLGKATKLKHICTNNHIYLQTPNNHLNSHGCPICRTSKGETIIFNYLKERNISFEKEKTFDGCIGRNNNKLKFDFYLKNYNLCIEFDGEQHFHVWRFKNIDEANEKLKRVQETDYIKNKYCMDNNIDLIRIPYTKINQIEIILNEELQKLRK